MATFTPNGSDFRVRFGNMVQHGSQWLQQWSADMDRLEEFASSLGARQTRWLDSGLLALGCGLSALIALAFQ